MRMSAPHPKQTFRQCPLSTHSGHSADVCFRPIADIGAHSKLATWMCIGDALEQARRLGLCSRENDV